MSSTYYTEKGSALRTRTP